MTTRVPAPSPAASCSPRWRRPPSLPWLGGRARAASMEEIKKRGYSSSPPKTISARSSSSRTASRPASTTSWSRCCANTRRSRSRQEILPWTGLLAGVSTGKYDVAITAAIITKERTQSLDFTSPIADATHYYVKRKADTSIKSIKDLNGKTCGVQAGSALLGRLPELKAMIEKNGGKMGKVVEYTSYPEAYQDLALGRTDYVVNTIINLKALVAEKPDVFETRPAGVGQVVSRPGRSRRATRSCWSSSTTSSPSRRRAARFAELQKKWFGEAFPDLPVTLRAGILTPRERRR